MFNMSLPYIIILYAVSIILTIMYFIGLARKGNYIFTLYNFPFFLYLFSVYVVGPFQVNMKSWRHLGVYNDFGVSRYVLQNFAINLLGLIVLMIVLIFADKRIMKKNSFSKFVGSVTYNVSTKVLMVVFSALILTWYGIVFYKLGSLPILGNRTFVNNISSIRPFYFAINILIRYLTIYFSIVYIIHGKKAHLLLCLVGYITLLFVGSRSPVFESLFIVLVFKMQYDEVKLSKKVLSILTTIPILLGISTLISFLRSNQSTTMVTLSRKVLDELVYGNTFSEIRDGAFVLFGAERSGLTQIYGLNYLADFLFFIPSSNSTFIHKWSWGSFSTNTLFGWNGHYGLRGGWFLEPYMNFGIFGIIFIAIVYGMILSWLNTNYEVILKSGSKRLKTKSFLIMYVYQYLGFSLLTSNWFTTAMVTLSLFIGVLIINLLVERRIYLISNEELLLNH